MEIYKVRALDLDRSSASVTCKDFKTEQLPWKGNLPSSGAHRQLMIWGTGMLIRDFKLLASQKSGPTVASRFRDPGRLGIMARGGALCAVLWILLQFADVGLNGFQNDILDPRTLLQVSAWGAENPLKYKILLMLSFGVFLVTALETSLRLIFPAWDTTSERSLSIEEIYQSIVSYAERLSQQEHFEHFFRVYDTFGRHLWLEGQLIAREKLGRLAENAAAKLGDDSRLAQILIDDLGWTKVALKRYTEARSSIQRGIEKASRAGSPFWQAKGVRHLAGIDTIENNYDGAIDRLNEAARIASTISDSSKREEMQAGILYARALTLLRQRKPSEALLVLDEFVKLTESTRDLARAVRAHALRGQTMIMLEKWDDAREAFTRGLRESERMGRVDEVIRNHRGLARCYITSDTDLSQHHKAAALKLEERTPIPFDIGVN